MPPHRKRLFLFYIITQNYVICNYQFSRIHTPSHPPNTPKTHHPIILPPSHFNRYMRQIRLYTRYSHCTLPGVDCNIFRSHSTWSGFYFDRMSPYFQIHLKNIISSSDKSHSAWSVTFSRSLDFC